MEKKFDIVTVMQHLLNISIYVGVFVKIILTILYLGDTYRDMSLFTKMLI